jgi:hypothetical protein
VATHHIPILGFATRPDDTGESWFEPEDLNFGTNDLARQFVLTHGSALAAAPTVKHGVYGGFRVPKNYNSGAKLVIEWSATLTSGDVVFDFDYNAVGGNDAESLDPSAWQESVTVTDTAPAVARRKLIATVNLTAVNFTVDDEVQFFFGRDGVDGADTMAGRAYVFNLVFEYTD